MCCMVVYSVDLFSTYPAVGVYPQFCSKCCGYPWRYRSWYSFALFHVQVYSQYIQNYRAL